MDARRQGGARGRLRAALLVLIGLLYAIAVPWYRETGAQPEIWLGLPDWVTVALACFVGIAVANSLAWLLTDVPDVPGDDAP